MLHFYTATRCTFTPPFTKWANANKTAQILVNYTEEPQTVTVNSKKHTNSKAVVFTKATGKGSSVKITDKGELNLIIDPLSAVMVEFGAF